VTGNHTNHPGMNLMMITGSPQMARALEVAGVDTIFVDLEVRGKAERQAGRDTVVSGHTVRDVVAVRASIQVASLLVRVNPWWDGSPSEIGEVLAARPDVVMLPFFKNPAEVRRFIGAIGGAARTCLLFETAEAVESVHEILDIPGIDIAFVGLNDLHLAYRKRFMFELLADGTVSKLCDEFASRDLKYGFGGMARIGALVPPAERVLAEHYRLGSSMVILSRSFCDVSRAQDVTRVSALVADGIAEIRAQEAHLRKMGQPYLERQHSLLVSEIESVVSELVLSDRSGGAQNA